MKIDFVITWVDGNDPEWRKEKEKYSGKTTGDDREKRYRDWELLRYWFRGVENCAPWVNKIHFVTCGHLPDWLDTGHPKLNIVNHKDYIPEQYLPTFSCRPIELNLHRIPGLSDDFVYFNDDMFLLRPV
ncbi:MAG: Stealth CR1 domain-containing protein, partial [Lachnospiraceae bacterium]|nr:Stealth CR1 domain-containing protein [Lachnospiraceae bacterium]